jgi:hypothetical protein
VIVERPLFAVDHNFPEPILKTLDELLGVEFVPVRKIHPSFAELDDWQLLLALHQHERPWDGLVTNDDAMLSLAKEMTVLSQTQLTLVVAKGEGHNPIRAIGVLLCHLSFICAHTTHARAQIWRLSVKQKKAEEPATYLDDIAAKAKTTAKALFEQHKLSARELRRKTE